MSILRSASLALLPLGLLWSGGCEDAGKTTETAQPCEGECCDDTTGDCDGDGFFDSVDCDDTDPEVNGGAEEICDNKDNDCDGLIDDQDDDLADGALYLDADRDGYGDEDVSKIGCDDAEGWVQQAGDCNDTDDAVSPDAEEICDLVDNDCDGLTDDEDDDVDGSTYYIDGDNDRYGTEEATVIACSRPEGYATVTGDCDDTDSSIYPDARDLEDDVDNDCDGEIDEDVTTGGGGSGDGPSNLIGYFVVGKFEDTWQCINYYDASGSDYSDEAICPGCDYSLYVEAEYSPGALAGSYDECDWLDLEYWSEIDAFDSIWGFNYEPAGYLYPVAYYYYATARDWYPVAYYNVGPTDYGYDYLSWTFFVQYDSSGTIEAGLFWGYIY